MHLAYPRGGGRAMIGAYRKDEVVRLVCAMCDGTITSDDTGQLDALLTKNEEARRFYNNYMFMHAQLYSQHASLAAVESGVLRRAGLSLVSNENQSSDQWDHPLRSAGAPKRILIQLLAVAAALIGVA